ncbi:GFA family protein [Pacificispira sp.]|uniref:GFA family protein n=1 Tax=Pacificispira sp. TaxID=2888761 RepID=UPI003B52CB47
MTAGPPVVRTAACACGQLTARCTGEPVSVSLCHCLDCQRRTGSPFGIAAFFDIASVSTGGESAEFLRRGDSGFDIAFHFCPRCGGTVYWYPAAKPGYVAVAVGAFADPTFPKPTKSVYTDRRHPWLDMP